MRVIEAKDARKNGISVNLWNASQNIGQENCIFLGRNKCSVS